MEITHYANSFIEVKSGSTKLVCDPWIGITRENAWISDPIHFNGANILKEINPDFIYISHIHCDHLDENLLRKIKKKNQVIIIKKFNIPTLKNRLLKLGFNKILEIKEWTVKKISKNISVSIVPQITNNDDDLESKIFYDMDTSIIIKCNNSNKVFYNNVDNPINIRHIKKIKTFVNSVMHSDINICTFPIGSASEYPQCFLNINRKYEKKKLLKKSLNIVEKKIKILNPEFFFPSGGTYKIVGKHSALNKYVALPRNNTVSDFKNKKYKVFNLIGGKKIIIDKQSFEIKKESIKNFFKSNKLNKILYSYQKRKKVNIKIIENLFLIARNNYYERLKKFNIKKNSWTINFFVFDSIKLNNLGNLEFKKSKLLKKFDLNLYNKESKKYLLDLYLDINLFYEVLTRKISWNLASTGSFILFKRKPNIFIPDIVFSLNFLTKD